MRSPAIAATSALSCLLAGCTAASSPGSSTCQYTDVLGIAVSGNTTTADHSAAPPGNQIKFFAPSTPTSSSPACEVPTVTAILNNATWTTSDPLDTSVVSTAGASNGLATCTGATSTAATITASTGSGTSAMTATATLTCK